MTLAMMVLMIYSTIISKLIFRWFSFSGFLYSSTRTQVTTVWSLGDDGATNHHCQHRNCRQLQTAVTWVLDENNPQFGQVVAALFATDCFMCTYCAKSSGILRQGQFENSILFSGLKWKKEKKTIACTMTLPGACWFGGGSWHRSRSACWGWRWPAWTWCRTSLWGIGDRALTRGWSCWL